MREHPASDGRPDGVQVPYPKVKNTRNPVPSLRTFASLCPNLANDGPPGNGIMREGHFIRELHRIHLAPPLQKRSSQPGGQCFEFAPRHPNEEPRPSEPRFPSFGLITC